MLRRIPLGQMTNLRDLGGYPTCFEGITQWECFLRGDAPQGLAEADLEWLKARDITTVIDLRSQPEIDRTPDELAHRSDFTYHHIPLVDGDLLPNQETDIGLGYFKLLDAGVGVAQVMHTLAAAPGGALFHCSAGKDRTGIIAMLLLALAGVSRADILADYSISGIYLAELMKKIRLAVPDMPAFAGQSKCEYMEDCMTRLYEKYGAPQDYLAAIGLADGELDRLRGKLLGRVG